MTLRGRLAWAFAAMLLVPAALLVLSVGLLRWAWGPEGGLPPEKGLRAVAILNEELRQDPDGLLSKGFDRLAAALPAAVSIGVRSGDTWVRTSPGFDKPRGFGPSPHTLFTWTFDAEGREAVLEVRWSPREAVASWGPVLAAPVILLVLVVGTLIVLTTVVSRGVLRPLKVLEAAARRLGDGDLEPGPLPSSPPEFLRVGGALDDLRRRLKESLLERQAVEEERRTWVASVSHDLRTPLSVIRGYAEGLLDGVASTPEKQKRYHEVILERARQLERQVDDLFQWARWDWGTPELRWQTMDLGEVLDEAVRAWADELPIAWERPEGTWPVRADALALRRLFDNLVRNVLHHAGPEPKLQVSLARADGYEVRFRDQGPGLSPEVLPRVFERFFRGDPARNPGQGGGGLGLTIARVLAEAHGGSLTAANAQPGAVFTLRLPQESP